MGHFQDLGIVHGIFDKDAIPKTRHCLLFVNSENRDHWWSSPDRLGKAGYRYARGAQLETWQLDELMEYRA